MIFVIDVGNTNMTMGVFCGEKLAATFRIMTKTPRTSDEYGIMITQLLKNNGIEDLGYRGSHHRQRRAGCDAFPDQFYHPLSAYEASHRRTRSQKRY